MSYSSDVINDLASLFPYISNMEKKYASYGLAVDYSIIVMKYSFMVVFRPYVKR